MNMKYERPIRNEVQGGFSLIELMIVLALGAVILFAAIGNYGSTNSQAQTDAEVRNLNSLIPMIKQTFGTAQGNYTGLSNGIMRRAANFPNTMAHPSDPELIRHSWADDGVELGVSGTNDEFFTITYKDVPGNSCQDLLTRVYRFFTEVTVNSTTVDGVASISSNCVPNASNPEAPVEIVMRAR